MIRPMPVGHKLKGWGEPENEENSGIDRCDRGGFVPFERDRAANADLAPVPAVKTTQLPTPPITAAPQGTPAADRNRRQCLARRLPALCDRQGRHSGRRGCRRQGRPGPDRAGLRLFERRQEDQGRPEADAVPARVDLQALHLDRADAAGRAGQGRPQRRRQQVHRLQDSALRGQADHGPQPDDPHAGLRGGGQGPDHARSEAKFRSTRC